MISLFNRKKNIYLDYMASTPTDPRVIAVLEQSIKRDFANAHATHSLGVSAAENLKLSLDDIARQIKSPTSALVVTSGATESNSLAIKGVIDKFVMENPGVLPHIIISNIEHPSVSGLVDLAARELIDLDFLEVDNQGIIKVQELESLLKPQTVLVSVMLVNSEIGTIQPINQVRKVINRWRKQSNLSEQVYPILHTDASQGMLVRELNVQLLHADLITINPHKFYGPNGIGFLYVNPLVKEYLQPLFLSGYEEVVLRPGTPVPALVQASATALTIVASNREDFNHKAREFFEFLKQELVNRGGVINGATDMEKRIPYCLSVSFSNINHEFLQMQLDAKGVYCATKSACLENDIEGSGVLQSLDSDITSALRISFGYETTHENLSTMLQFLDQAISIQRSRLVS